MTEKYESAETSSPENSGQSALITFTDPAGITVVRGNGDTHGHLLIAGSVDYPQPGLDTNLDGLLLPQRGEGNGRRLELPVNYVTMAQAMNDAIGSSVSPESIELMRKLFVELGSSVRGLIDTGHLMPEGISYKNIIFSRDEEGPKLLPPIKFIPVESAGIETARHDVVKTLGASCMAGAANATQANNLQAVFSGFEQTLEG